MENLENEIWVVVNGCNGNYSVSNMGRIKSNRSNRILRPTLTRYGYREVHIRNKIEKVHRVVGEHFITPIDGKREINHLNGVKTDNRVDNLEWCTRSENQLHKYRVLNSNTNSHNVLLLTESMELICVFPSLQSASSILHLSSRTIVDCIMNRKMIRHCYIQYNDEDKRTLPYINDNAVL